MTHHNDQFRTRKFRGKFQTAENVVIDKIARDPRHKKITNTSIKHDFRWNSRIQTTQHRRKRKLPAGCLFDLRQIIPVRRVASNEARVACFEHLQCLRWRDRGLRFASQRGVLRGGVSWIGHTKGCQRKHKR